MDNSVDADLAARSDAGAIEDRGTGSQENVVIGGASGEVGTWARKYVIAQAKRITPGSAQHGVLHDDALLAELDPAAFRSQDGSEQDPAVGADMHVPAHDRSRRDISTGVNLGRCPAMFQQHASSPFNRVVGTTVPCPVQIVPNLSTQLTSAQETAGRA
jgi:hypothetical protein